MKPLRPKKTQRSGTILVCVLACSLIAITLGAAAIALALKSTREGMQTLAMRQSQWLLEAAVLKSQQRIAAGNFEDHQWQVPAEVMLGGVGVVSMDVQESGSEMIQIAVSVEYSSRENLQIPIVRSYTYRQPRTDPM